MPPLIPAFARVALGPTGAQTTFTTDPEPYEPYRWPKRVSVHRGLQGAITIQDFGVFAKDRQLQLSHDVMDDEVIKTLDGYFRTKGATFRFTDWLGNDFTVFILSFTHVPHGRLAISSYELALHVLGITQLFGSPYTGS